jgi:hypothetical protein
MLISHQVPVFNIAMLISHQVPFFNIMGIDHE